MDRLLVAVVPLLLVAPLVVAMFWAMSRSMDRRLGGRGQATMLRTALRTGVVPDDAVRERWAAQATKAVRRGPQTWVGWTIIVVLVAMATAPLLRIGSPTTGDLILTLVLFGPLVVMVYVVMVPMQRRSHRRWRRLDALLNRTAADRAAD